MGGNRVELPSVKGQKVFAFCGLGNPASFEKTLQLLGYDIVGFKSFIDHHHYSPADENGLMEEARRLRADFIITTSKDRVKLQRQDWSIPLLSLRIEVRITKGQDELASTLMRIMSQ
jgi:tetraacyldisaccharide 4'-kinase